MALVLVSFQIPFTEDKSIGSGTRHPPFRWKKLQDVLYTRFGGWTRFTGEAHGVWKDPNTGQPVYDRSRIFQVDVETDQLNEIRGILRSACLTFVQQSIRAVIDGKPEFFIGGSGDEPL